MKLSYCGAAILLGVTAAFATAQPPAKKPGGVPQVVLLSNFTIVEGDVERIGDELVVRRGKEVEKYAIVQVACVGESRDAVFRQMFARGPSSSQGGNRSALIPFASRVQPVLTNLCASCHAKSDHASAFKLVRVPEGYAIPEASGKNAAAVVRFLSKENPTASPFLVKSISAHGGQRTPAIADRNHPAYQNLEQWARAVVLELAPSSSTVAKAPTSPAPTPKSTTEDPYDPAAFNRAKSPNR